MRPVVSVRLVLLRPSAESPSLSCSIWNSVVIPSVGLRSRWEAAR